MALTGAGHQWKPVSARSVENILSCHTESDFSLSVPAQVIFSSWPHEPMKDSLIVSKTLSFKEFGVHC